MAPALLVVALVAAACSGSDDWPRGGDQAAPTVGADPGDGTDADGDRALPFDEAVRSGTLDNGLTWYVRHNGAPGERAQLRLVVGAGSVDEAPDQSGVAHFLEHMLFNGTERWPGTELVHVLESFGSAFGPDVNASTTYDDTVYQLSMPTDGDLVEQGLDVLVQWAAHAAIDPEEVVAERGVVEEEWRLRAQGANARVIGFYDELLTAGTAYEGREPIGTVEAIRAMEAEPLRRFYEDWYVPTNMAVVVVGDIDVDDVAAMIADRFGVLAAADTPARVDTAFVDNDTVLVDQFVDAEIPTSYIELLWPGPASVPATAAELRTAIAVTIAASIVDTRFGDDTSRGEVPYLRAYTSSTPLVPALDTPGLLAEAPPGDLAPSLDALLVEIERVRRDGFGPEEVTRAVESALAASDQALAGAPTVQDAQHAASIVEHHLRGAPLLSAADAHALEQEILRTLTAEEIAAAWLDVIERRAPVVVSIGPADEQEALPTEREVLDAIERVAGADIDGRSDASADITALMDPPAPAAIVDEVLIDELGASVLTLENGVRVGILPTGIDQHAVEIAGVGPAGLAAVALDDLPAAFAAPEVVVQSGVDAIDQVSVDRLLSDRVLAVSFSVDQTRARTYAQAATDDVELALQLLNRYLRAPRINASALARFVGQVSPYARDPASLPGLASTVELVDARFGGDPRYAILPSVDELESLDADRVRDVFTDLYGAADDWVFTIVGDIDPETARDLAQRYLGTLVVDGDPVPVIGRQPSPPPGVVDRTVSAGSDPQGSVTVLATTEFAADPVDEIGLAGLQQILGTRLRDHLREELGATYSPSVTVAAVHEPDELVETSIQVSGDPAELDVIVDGIAETLADLADGGVGDAEAATAAEQLRRERELVTNGFWTAAILDAMLRPGVPVLSVPDTLAVIGELDAATLDALALEVIDPGHYIVIRSIPAA